MDGAKAYIFPAVAALVLLAYFIFRPATPSGADDAASSEATLPTRADIEAAVREAGPPDGLDAAVADDAEQAVAVAVENCRDATQTAQGELRVRATVVAADNLGGHFLDVELTPEPAEGLEGLTACVRRELGEASTTMPRRTQRGSISGVY